MRALTVAGEGVGEMEGELYFVWADELARTIERQQ
jgi:hypothetical protein